MSHTYNTEDVVFNYNSDFSGNVQITEKATGATVNVRASALLNLVANYIRNERIAHLDGMSAAQVLGLPHG